MKWSARYSTGIKEVDQQHQMLFRMSDDYREALDAGEGASVYGLMLEALDAYARDHFGFEEQCMLRYRCPAAQANSDAHHQFLEALDVFQKRFARKGFTRADAYRLLDYIDDWLTNHIGRMDRQLRPCVEGAAGA